MSNPKKIIISRTDNLGDVILTLPLAGALKKKFPDCIIAFLGKTYTKPLIDACIYIDSFINWNEILSLPENLQVQKLSEQHADAIIHVFPNKTIAHIARKAKIPIRIGTNRRIFHLTTCNKRVNLSRKNAPLHEAQLNLKLLSALGVDNDFSLEEINDLYGFRNISPLPQNISSLLDAKKFNLVIHPKSKGSAREWGTENFKKLIELLPENDFKIFVTGTKEEGELISEFLHQVQDKITNLCGKLNLDELISFIAASDGLVAASTGPLHIAAACGKTALGIFAPMHAIRPQRWAPVGEKADFFVLDKKCSDCRRTPENCLCIKSIAPELVAARLKNEDKNKK